MFALADFALAIGCNNDSDCGANAKCIDGKCVRALEITYPKIGEEKLTEEVIAKEGLPGYVKYVFNIAVIIIGLIIFGVLIFSGLKYLTSAGDPEQMEDAKNGILMAFFGGLILLASTLFFNTINSQLTILETPKLEILEQFVEPGVYICSYNVTEALKNGEVKIDDQPITNYPDIATVINDYINEGVIEGEEQIEKQNRAANTLRAIMRLDDEKVCPKVNFSGNFENFKVTSDKTIFIIPSIETIINQNKKKERKAKYEYGIVLHEKEYSGGRCDYFPKDVNDLIYRQIDGYSAQNLAFTAYSVTLFKKPSSEPTGDGVILYQDFNYNTASTSRAFKPNGNQDIFKAASLGDLKDNSRSIKFRPKLSYLALLYESENFAGECRLLYINRPNLFDVLPTQKCEMNEWGIYLGECYPVLGSMIVIKGSFE